MSVCGTLFRCTVAIGAPEPRRRFTLSGRQFFQHRLSGVRELRQRVRPVRAAAFFLHRLCGVHEARRRFARTGGRFSLNLSGGELPRPAEGGQEGRHQGLPVGH